MTTKYILDMTVSEAYDWYQKNVGYYARRSPNFAENVLKHFVMPFSSQGEPTSNQGSLRELLKTVGIPLDIDADLQMLSGEDISPGFRDMYFIEFLAPALRRETGQKPEVEISRFQKVSSWLKDGRREGATQAAMEWIKDMHGRNASQARAAIAALGENPKNTCGFCEISIGLEWLEKQRVPVHYTVKEGIDSAINPRPRHQSSGSTIYISYGPSPSPSSF